MTVTYSDPVKNADINKSKAALVEIIDELRTRFARKNDAWSEAEALAASRLELLRRWDVFRVSKGITCLICGKKPAYHLDEKKYIDIHTSTCEWLEELGDE